MHKISRKGFVHSIKVPRLYKVASVICKKVVEEGGSLKDLVYSSGHKNIKGIYALVVKTIEHSKELDVLIKNSKLLERETGLQPWLAKILITELLYGKKNLKGESKPVKIVLSYKKEFESLACIRKTDLESNNVIDFEDTFLVFLIYSSAMLILPLLTFFGTKNLLEKEFHVVGTPNVAWSVISAVIVVNIIIMMYALRGYRQEVAEESRSNENIQEMTSREDLTIKKDS